MDLVSSHEANVNHIDSHESSQTTSPTPIVASHRSNNPSVIAIPSMPNTTPRLSRLLDSEPGGQEESSASKESLTTEEKPTCPISPTIVLLDKEVEKCAAKGNGRSKELELMEMVRDKYKKVSADRDQLLKKNLALNNSLQKAHAQITLRSTEAQKLVKQSHRESSQWKDFANAAQVENAELVTEVQRMREKLELMDPDNLEIVKQYQDLVKDLQKCHIVMGKEKESRIRLENLRGELEIQLEQEKVSAMFKVEAKEAEFKSNIKKLEAHNCSLLQQLNGLKINLSNTKIGCDISKSETQMLKWLLEQRKGKNQKRHQIHRGKASHVRSCSVESAGKILKPRLHRTGSQSHRQPDDDMTVTLGLVMARAEKHQKEFNKLYEQYQVVLKERDEATDRVESLKKRVEYEFPINDQMSEEAPNREESGTERPLDYLEIHSHNQHQKASDMKMSSDTLVAKIEVLEMELRHKSRIITYLEREHADQLGNVLHYQDPHRPLKKWEHTRYQIFKADVGDREEELQGEDEQLLLNGETIVVNHDATEI